MTAKEFLRRARSVDRRVDEATERVKRIRAQLEAGRMSSVTGMPRGGAKDWTETADRLIELEQRVNAQVREMVRWKLAAIDAIDAVEEARLREVLELYYIDGYSWEEVAKALHYDKSWVLRLHGQALLKVKVPEDFHSTTQGASCFSTTERLRLNKPWVITLLEKVPWNWVPATSVWAIWIRHGTPMNLPWIWIPTIWKPGLSWLPLMLLTVIITPHWSRLRWCWRKTRNTLPLWLLPPSAAV